MSVLCDQEIADLCSQCNMVYSFDPTLVNPASLDVRLGNTLQVETDSRTSEFPDGWMPLDMVAMRVTEENPYILLPHHFVLGSTLEVFNIPDDICAFFYLKSSRARERFEHSHATFCDPGWSGSVLTLELSNVSRFEKLRLWPGKLIGQIVFMRMSQKPRRTYRITGRYNYDLKATPSKG